MKYILEKDRVVKEINGISWYAKTDGTRFNTLKEALAFIGNADQYNLWKSYKMIAYISGRINGDDNYIKKFARVKKQLERKCYEVLNPAEEPDGLSYDEYMDRALVNVDRADKVYFMPDWILSNGCADEFETAFRHDKEISFIKPSKAWKIISRLLSYYSASKMKKIIGAQDYRTQMAKISDEIGELQDSDKKKQCPLYPIILKNLIRSKSYGWHEVYKSLVKGTPQEECADCFIALSGLRNCTDDTAGVIRRRLKELADYCFSYECVLHIILKLKYNKVREDWT